ncbi:thiamine pyrophosphate-dependent dehydrogenase E1 component subunit alpha [Effusibacillus lacus]|uniref:2-oxoisovalerate dehydrogenase subunit alpha n=1 Tax=Effusibacillus lacus TaxID=1348429 RepID=A0A292YSZ8_9BACL|nr:thiamine pyrophosphate-dependent dehydrogenase E1 component subunit alpha [Effusibacillus lacus]TCS76350.1 branched-chain alpha-keto acid dehydrogenase E1 component [Effusibacillus lacus]GAX91893.1 2-oxoisovalerate dehydrogenase [Effusibacillus lacus]
MNKHEELGLSKDQLLEMYSYMLLARRLDERQWLLNRAGKVPFVISCQGQEAAQIGAAYALDRQNDYVCPYYRDLGVVLVFGQTARDTMMAAFAKPEDPNSGGRQMPGHFGGKKYRIVTGSSPVATQVPHAVGIALAAKMRGEQTVAFTSLGEGSTNQGDFHEACNFAGVHKLPVIFYVENNKYAISVPISKQLACENVADRALGYGMPGVIVDGNDVLEVYRVFKEARERAVRGEGPTLIEAKTYRLVPHSSDDDDRSYRSREEVEEAKKRDPILKFREYLMQQGFLTEELAQQFEERVMKEVNEATEAAEKAPYAEPESALLHVYAD